MNVPCDMLLHPELLTSEQLAAILQERQLRVPDMETLPRDELLELFHHYCVPYGQRKYRDTGRGRLLNKSRHTSPERTPKVILNNDNQSRKLSLPVNERLKPPPDLLSGHIKRIKLENKIIITNDRNVLKRKLAIDNRLGFDHPPSFQHALKTTVLRTCNICQTTFGLCRSLEYQLRNQRTQCACQSPVLEVPPHKKDRKPITWP